MVEPGVSYVRRERDEPFRTARFELTAEHVTLLRAFYVNWQEDEWGAPEIDPKRPYGNSNLDRDLYETLHGTGGWDDEHALPRVLTADEWAQARERNRQLHRETRTALQIVLRAGSFEPGIYEAREYHEDWRRADA